jgi:hypothetical protein
LNIKKYIDNNFRVSIVIKYAFFLLIAVFLTFCLYSDFLTAYLSFYVPSFFGKLLENTSFALLSFLLGFSLISLSKYRTKLSLAERLVIGALISNFVLVVPTLITGIVLQAFVREFFIFYSFMTFLFVLIYADKILCRLSYRLLRSYTRQFSKVLFTPAMMLVVFICAVQLIFILTIIMHPLLNSYDYVSFQGPIVKAIVTSNSIPTNIPYTQLLGDFTPGVLLLHAFAETTSVIMDFRFISYLHFLLSLVVVYLFCKDLLNNKQLGIVAAAIMTFMPAIFAFFSFYSVYTEMSLMFYIISAVFCLVKGLKSNKAFWFIFAGIGIALTLLSKNVGLYGVFMILSIVPLFFRSRKLKVAGLLFCFVPSLYRLYLNAFVNVYLSSFYFELAIAELVFIALIGTVMGYVVLKTSIDGSLNIRNSFSLLLFSSAGLIWYIRNFFTFGTPTLNIAPTYLLSKAQSLYATIFPPTYGNTGTIFDTLRFDYILTFTYLGSLLIVPKIIGFFKILKQSQGDLVESHRKEWLIVIFPMLLYLVLWSVIFYGIQTSTALRNGLIVIPFLSMVTAYGVLVLIKKLRVNSSLSIGLITLLLVLYLLVGFNVNLGLSSPLLPRITPSEPIISYTTFLWALFPPLVICLIALASRLVKTPSFSKLKWKIASKKAIFKIGYFLVFFAILTSLIFTPFLSLSKSLYQNNFDVSKYQVNSYPVFSKAEYDLSLIDYFNTDIHDDLTIVGYWLNGLSYFTGHRTFDTIEALGIADVYDIATSTNATHMLNLLADKRIGYIVLPLPNSPYYTQFVRFSNTCPFYNLVLNTNYATFLGNFDFSALYRLNYTKDSFYGMVDARVVSSNESDALVSPTFLGDNNVAQQSFDIGDAQELWIKLVFDVSGLSAFNEYTGTVEALVTQQYDNVSSITRLNKAFKGTNNNLQEIYVGPLAGNPLSKVTYTVGSVEIRIQNSSGKELSILLVSNSSGVVVTAEQNHWYMSSSSQKLTEYIIDGSPTSLSDDILSFFHVSLNGEAGISLIADNELKINNSSSLKVQVEIKEDGEGYIYHDFVPHGDWEGFRFLSFYWYGTNSKERVEIMCRSSNNSYWIVTVTDDFSGMKRFLIPLSTFEPYQGEPTWNHVNAIIFRFLLTRPYSVTWHLDQVALV